VTVIALRPLLGEGEGSPTPWSTWPAGFLPPRARVRLATTRRTC